MALWDTNERRGLWPCEGSVLQCRGVPGQGSRSGWVSKQGMGDKIGSFQRRSEESLVLGGGGFRVEMRERITFEM